MRFTQSFEVIVIGGGHAGTEAALAAARMGASTLLLTHNVETLGQMSCNPAIGGIGKGHLVREIDALGGAMARAADRAGIQFRILNGSKGPAVRATRAQADRLLYKQAIRAQIESEPRLAVFQQEVTDLMLAGDAVRAVVTATGIVFAAPCVVLTAGTFLGGRIHVGLDSHAGGRAGEAASNRLSQRLRELALRTGRLKTGTPPRLDGRTIDYSVMPEQHSDQPLPVFSFLGRPGEHPRQVPCHITHTTEHTHAIIRAATDRSPMFTGAIEGVGPRYCPSIEDKVVRFPDRTSHQIFVEPEGLTTHEIYPNGISTSLPFDVQIALIHSIPGFQNAHVTRPGYAIEYDFFDPRDLRPSLESRAVRGLYFAGQINGTTGYEEAAAQGLLAGINAARATRGQEPWIPGRSDGYLGVLIDDLVTRGTREPYRMFTSRAEHRLLLREDNADTRLTPIGRDMGLIDDERWRLFEAKQRRVEYEVARLRSVRLHPTSLDADWCARVLGGALARDVSAFELLRRPEVAYPALLEVAGPDPAATEEFADDRIASQVSVQVEALAKYAGYIERQLEEIERQRRNEQTRLPEDIDYAQIAGLSHEVRARLTEYRPATLGQAGRVPGVTPAAVTLLLVHLKKRAHGAAARVA